jgi:hypothetical protein
LKIRISGHYDEEVSRTCLKALECNALPPSDSAFLRADVLLRLSTEAASLRHFAWWRGW